MKKVAYYSDTSLYVYTPAAVYFLKDRFSLTIDLQPFLIAQDGFPKPFPAFLILMANSSRHYTSRIKHESDISIDDHVRPPLGPQNQEVITG